MLHYLKYSYMIYKMALGSLGYIVFTNNNAPIYVLPHLTTPLAKGGDMIIFDQ